MKALSLLLFTLIHVNLISQTTVYGKVIDNQGIPIMGANVYLEGTYEYNY